MAEKTTLINNLKNRVYEFVDTLRKEESNVTKAAAAVGGFETCMLLFYEKQRQVTKKDQIEEKMMTSLKESLASLDKHYKEIAKERKQFEADSDKACLIIDKEIKDFLKTLNKKDESIKDEEKLVTQNARVNATLLMIGRILTFAFRGSEGIPHMEKILKENFEELLCDCPYYLTPSTKEQDDILTKETALLFLGLNEMVERLYREHNAKNKAFLIALLRAFIILYLELSVIDISKKVSKKVSDLDPKKIREAMTEFLTLKIVYVYEIFSDLWEKESKADKVNGASVLDEYFDYFYRLRDSMTGKETVSFDGKVSTI